jgi:hypothetical protein
MDIDRVLNNLENAGGAIEYEMANEEAIEAINYLRQQLTKPADEVLIEAAKAVVERWETPLWKDAPHTGDYIYRLRDALNAYKPTEG